MPKRAITTKQAQKFASASPIEARKGIASIMAPAAKNVETIRKQKFYGLWAFRITIM